MNTCTFATPVGTLRAEERDNALVSLEFDRTAAAGTDYPSELLKKTVREITEYFEGRRRDFDIPLDPAGTDFQKKVWEQLLRIPYGQTRSYGEIARAAGNPNASRAVGHANNQNRIVIIIPCHRVIGADGSLVGYGGGLDVKRFLLTLESRHA